MTAKTRANKKAILGKKIGMTQLFNEEGRFVPVTVVCVGPCTVLQVRSEEKDGYTAYQLGFDETRKPRANPQQAQLDRLGVKPKRFVKEVPFIDPADVIGTEGGGGNTNRGGEGDGKSSEGEGEQGGGGEGDGAPSEVQAGMQIGASAFKDIAYVDVRGQTKGRGFSGTIRRHGFSAGDHSHGSKNVREPGSTGMHTDPGRVLKGKKMSGQFGMEYRKARNLAVFGIDEEQNLLLIKGGVPGSKGTYVYVEESLRSS